MLLTLIFSMVNLALRLIQKARLDGYRGTRSIQYGDMDFAKGATMPFKTHLSVKSS